MGGTETMVHVPMMSPTQKPGHVTSGIMHKCKQRGTRPPAGMGSSRDCGAVHLRNIGIHLIGKRLLRFAHRGKIDEQCILMYDAKHLSTCQKVSDMTSSARPQNLGHNASYGALWKKPFWATLRKFDNADEQDRNGHKPVRFIHRITCFPHFGRIRVRESGYDPIKH